MRYNIPMKLFTPYHRRATGNRAEKLAEKYLHQQGLKTVANNYHCRFGEIDLIMQNNDQTLIFVEVRSRAANARVSAIESINTEKIKKIRKTAQYYLMRYQKMPNCRFDVIAMTQNLQNSGYTIDWIKNAF